MLSVSTSDCSGWSVATLSMMIRIAFGGVHQPFSNQTHAWAVDDCIDNHANYAQQEQPDGRFCTGFDFNLLFTAQFNQALFQTLAINRIVREFGVEQRQ